MGYASRDPVPLSEIAVIDEDTIAIIAARVPSGYTHPSTHPASMITEDSSRRFVTDTEKGTWNAKVSPETGKGLYPDVDAQKLANIEENAGANNISDVNAALLTQGQEITLHRHASSGGLTQQQILRLI